ncbi:MAG: SchA/CurD-like domain-containing protein [Pseudonocardiaceae bacterium]
MPLAAITYRVKPGHEDEIAEIFSRFQRVDTPVINDEAGAPVGKLLGTAVFIKDDVMVRVINFEGDFRFIAKHMAKQEGVHLIEDQIAPYLANPRNTATEADFKRYFADAVMRCISQLDVTNHPAASKAG